MKGFVQTLTTTVIALLLFAFQANAAMWQAISTTTPTPYSAGQDIINVTVTDNGGPTYTFDMDLAGKPTASDAGTQFNIYVGSTTALPSDPTQLITSALYKYTIITTMTTYGSLMFDFTDPNNPVQKDVIASQYFSGGTSRLEWIVNKADVVSAPFYFMGTTDCCGDLRDFTNVAATPIPAAAWLLATGLLSIIGLKRKTL